MRSQRVTKFRSEQVGAFEHVPAHDEVVIQLSE
jgi:hypothetical protein